MVEVPTTVIVICSCHGRIAERLPLDDITQFLAIVAPDVPVIIGDDLCKRNALNSYTKELKSREMVIGACSQVVPKRYLWEKGLDEPPRLERIVSILDELSMPYSSHVIAERVKLLLWAQLKRLDNPKQIWRDNLKLTFSARGWKFSRREFLTSALPRYEVIPSVEHSKCAGGDKCHICYDCCPLSGVTIHGGLVSINTDICNGCGTCSAMCPCRAIYYPAFSPEELSNEMEGLLFGKHASLEPRIIALSCRTCLPDCVDSGGHIVYAPSILPLRLPSLGMASPWLLLRAFDMGAQGLAIISGIGKCCANSSAIALQDNIGFVQAVLEYWGIERERLRLFKVTQTNMTDVAGELSRFAKRVASLGPTALWFAESTLVPAEGVLRLSVLIEAVTNRLGCQPKSSITEGMVPFGRITLDCSRCTGCGLCGSYCPTGALNFQLGEDGNDYKLIFRHGYCLACAICIRVCPENCLALQRILEIDKMSCSKPILSDSIVRCERCGKPVAPRSMIDGLRSMLQKAGEYSVDHLDLCSVCKVETVHHVENNLVAAFNEDLADKCQV